MKFTYSIEHPSSLVSRKSLTIPPSANLHNIAIYRLTNPDDLFPSPYQTILELDYTRYVEPKKTLTLGKIYQLNSQCRIVGSLYFNAFYQDKRLLLRPQYNDQDVISYSISKATGTLASYAKGDLHIEYNYPIRIISISQKKENGPIGS